MINQINTTCVPQPIGPYSQAIMTQNFLFISGQIPIQIESQEIPDDISQQTKIVLNNIKCLLDKANFQVKNIIKTTIFITNLKKIHKINEIYELFFKQNFVKIFPARSCVEVSALPKNSKIEIETIAYKK